MAQVLYNGCSRKTSEDEMVRPFDLFFCALLDTIFFGVLFRLIQYLSNAFRLRPTGAGCGSANGSNNQWCHCNDVTFWYKQFCWLYQWYHWLQGRVQGSVVIIGITG